MRLLFGDELDYARGGLVLMGAGMGLYLGAATLTQAALAAAGARGGDPGGRRRLRVRRRVLALDLDDRVLQVEVAFAAARCSSSS